LFGEKGDAWARETRGAAAIPGCFAQGKTTRNGSISLQQTTCKRSTGSEVVQLHGKRNTRKVAKWFSLD
jgi:hypothetical protein